MFSKTRQTDHFGILNELLSTQDINVARFARNVKWDFSRDFQTPCCYRNLNPRENSPKSNLLKNCIDFLFSSDRGNSVEDDRSPGIMTASRSSPPTIHLSPSRQSSSSTDGGHGTGGAGAGNASAASGNSLSVAKKKRELFSARSSRSGGSNKSSDASMDLSSKVSKWHAKSKLSILHFSACFSARKVWFWFQCRQTRKH